MDNQTHLLQGAKDKIKALAFKWSGPLVIFIYSLSGSWDGFFLYRLGVIPKCLPEHLCKVIMSP